jgi:hypothetical protein
MQEATCHTIRKAMIFRLMKSSLAVNMVHLPTLLQRYFVNVDPLKKMPPCGETFDAYKWRRCGQYVQRVLAPLQRGQFFNTTLISVNCITAGFATLL